MTKATAPTADFDLGALRSIDSAELVIKHPVSGVPTPWIWTVAGPGHPDTKAANNSRQRRVQLEALEERLRPKRAADIADPEQDRLQLAEDLAARVLDWRGGRLDGADLPYTKAKAAEILADANFGWVLTQLADFLTAEKSFIRSSAKTS